MNDLQSELERKMQQLTGHVKGQLMIGASRTVGEYVLPYVICKFKEDYPDVDVTLEIYNTKHVEEKVMGRYLDIGLVEGPPVDKDLESIPFLDDELVVITSVDHPWSKLESISIFELDQIHTFPARKAPAPAPRSSSISKPPDFRQTISTS